MTTAAPVNLNTLRSQRKRVKDKKAASEAAKQEDEKLKSKREKDKLRKRKERAAKVSANCFLPSFCFPCRRQ